MTKDEKEFVKMIVDLDSNVLKAKKYIKENFNIESEYNADEHTIKLSCNNINESLNLLSAKKYIDETFDRSILVEF